MKLRAIRLSNFQSFGSETTEVSLARVTYLIGPNGSGKTAVLQALCRLFAFDPSLRRIQRSDFHVPHDEKEIPDERQLWIEADFVFPELRDGADNITVAPHFVHMRLDEPDGLPRVRYRLSATMGINGDIEESFVYVLDINADGTPKNIVQVSRTDRNTIQIHYLPARRDPASHIAYSVNSLLGRLLRAANWDSERETIKGLTSQISGELAANGSIKFLSECLEKKWNGLHKGGYFVEPRIAFENSELEALLRHLSVSFSPGHGQEAVDSSRLSDGQKSMLYLSLVLAFQAVGRATLNGKTDSFDVDKLHPPVYTLVSVEEPENSLSPHYLGRIVNSLVEMAGKKDSQALIATHAPSMLRRVDPKSIRYLRLNVQRSTQVSRIRLPKKEDVAHKFVREAVQAFPEIYFSRLVILGEGDSEEIVLPRILSAKGVPVDESGVSIAPLGGRHVNHFWRLLSELEIPYITLLDLDVARHQGGWGRISYVNDQLDEYRPAEKLPSNFWIPNWNSKKELIRDYPNYIEELEHRGIFFSSPMDIDFAMLLAFPDKYAVETKEPSDAIIKAVLGDCYNDSSQYSVDELKYFGTYHKLFKLGSKPATHMNALSDLSNAELLSNMPEPLAKLADAVIAKLAELPE